MIPKSQLKIFTSLGKKKFRNEAGVFLVEGRKLVEESMRSDANIKHVIATDVFFNEWNQVIDESIRVVAGAKDMERISSLKTAPEVIAVVHQFEEKGVYGNAEIIIALDGINDPGNFGTIIRTCDWFGVTQIICSENCVELYNPKVIQASMGSVFRVNIHYASLGTELHNLKNGHSYKVLLADAKGSQAIDNSNKEKKILLMGSESHGVSEELYALADEKIAIPKYGEAESLNVAIANAILLSQLKN
ncbi:MAG: RNA methyltransferase [Bacteroidia bacterium]|nr:RNA methyltransferase [Bacteroidia bacterium]